MSFFTALLIFIIVMLLFEGLVHNSVSRKVLVPIRKEDHKADRHYRK
jgi:hypothetical protein